MNLTRFSSAVCCILLSGCALVPESPMPVLAEPEKLRSGTPIVQEGESVSNYAWWTRFKDPQLNDLIDQALTNNHDMQIAVANVEQAEAQLRAAQYAWLPTLDAQGGAMGSGGIDTSYSNRGSASFSNGLGRLSVVYGEGVRNFV